MPGPSAHPAPFRARSPARERFTVVHGGLSVEADPSTGERPVAPAPPPSSHAIGLITTFGATFCATTAIVLLGWQLAAPERMEVPARVEIVHVDRPVPVPVLVPVLPTPAFADPPVVMPASASPAPTRRTTTASPSTPKAEPPQAAVAEPPPDPPIRAVPPPPPPPVAPAPSVARPPSVAVVPTEARVLSGTYNGRANGKPVTMTLWFGAEGAVSASIDGLEGSRIDATGAYELVGDSARVVLMERGVDKPLGYTGTVGPAGADGRITESGRNAGKFTLSK